MCLPVRLFILCDNVLISCHRNLILMKVSSSTLYISLAAQQQPRWWLKAQLQSIVLWQVRGPSYWTGCRNGKERQKREGGWGVYKGQVQHEALRFVTACLKQDVSANGTCLLYLRWELHFSKHVFGMHSNHKMFSCIICAMKMKCILYICCVSDCWMEGMKYAS